MPPRRTVYILRSRHHLHRHYVGSTGDLTTRLFDHNRGAVVATAKYAPWQLRAAFWFAAEETARAFERYLKTGSGRAFAKRHFQQPV